MRKQRVDVKLTACLLLQYGGDQALMAEGIFQCSLAGRHRHKAKAEGKLGTL